MAPEWRMLAEDTLMINLGTIASWRKTFPIPSSRERVPAPLRPPGWIVNEAEVHLECGGSLPHSKEACLPVIASLRSNLVNLYPGFPSVSGAIYRTPRGACGLPN